LNQVELVEWGRPKQTRLSAAELRTLLQFDDRLKIREGRSGSTSIGPRDGFVGLARLSPDLQVVVRPKVPVTQLLSLISLAYEGKELPRTTGSALYDEASPQEWLPFMLAIELEHLFGLGLRRGYVDISERSSYLRGRIEFCETLSRSYDASQPVCRYSDFTIDTIENRFIRSVVEMMLTTVLDRGIRRRLHDATEFMNGVSIARPDPTAIPSINSNPLMQHYGPAIALCSLYLRGMGIELEPGSVAAPGFFVPMHEVFERAMVNALAKRLGRNRIIHHRQFSHKIVFQEGAPALSITLIPDAVAVGSSLRAIVSRDERVLLVIDTKYKRPTRTYRGRPVFHNADVYQIISYCEALECPGILLYPRVDGDVDVSYRLNDTRFRMLTVDLALPALRGIAEVVEALAALIESLPGAEPRPAA
jgi:5-methylcytosine-specific restriction enzyme subunit McrC